MTDNELAKALVQADKLTQQQVFDLAAQLNGRGLAQTAIETGALTTGDILAVDPHAFDAAPIPVAPPAAQAFSTPPPPFNAPSISATINAPVYDSAGSSGAIQTAPSGEVSTSVINEAWALAGQQRGVWTITALLSIIIYGVAYAIFHQMGDVVETVGNNVVSAFLTAGIYRMAINQVRGKQIGVGDVFSVIDVFPAIIIATLLTILAVALGFILFIIPGIVIATSLILTMPIIVDQRLSATEAMGLSWKTLQGKRWAAFWFCLVTGLVSCIGIFLFGIGLLFTLPILPLSVALLYRNFFMAQAAPVMAGAALRPPIPEPRGF